MHPVGEEPPPRLRQHLQQRLMPTTWRCSTVDLTLAAMPAVEEGESSSTTMTGRRCSV